MLPPALAQLRLVRPTKRYCKVMFIIFAAALCGNTTEAGSAPYILIDQPTNEVNATTALSTQTKMKTPVADNVIEILISDIKPGRRDEFHKLRETA